MDTKAKRPELDQHELIDELPAACASEAAAIAWFEAKRWGATGPCCPKCGGTDVYTMKGRDGQRNKRWLWRCRDCGGQYTVRTGTVYAESLIPLHKWCLAMWECAIAKNGTSALEMSRRLQISYKAALFMLHRIRHAMADSPDNPPPKLSGTVEVDETFVGGKPRGAKWRRDPGVMKRKPREKWSTKVPVVAAVQRGGDVRASVVDGVSAANLKRVMQKNIERGTPIMTDERNAYRALAPEMGSPHGRVRHYLGEYVSRRDPNVHTNTIEGFFSRVKRGLNGTYHSVSKEHLHRYIAHFAFTYNTRRMNDGERTLRLIKRTEGKRLMYKDPVKKSA